MNFNFHLLDSFPENFSSTDVIEQKLQRILENNGGLYRICIHRNAGIRFYCQNFCFDN